MPGAEIVERQPGAKLADAMQHLAGVLRVFHHQRFGELELEGAAREPRTGDDGAQIMDEVLPQQLPRRDVDAGEDRVAAARAVLPGAELACGTLEHEQTEVDDETDLLRNVDE